MFKNAEHHAFLLACQLVFRNVVAKFLKLIGYIDYLIKYGTLSVSYTHLDVYKRQQFNLLLNPVVNKSVTYTLFDVLIVSLIGLIKCILFTA